jgi:hypothetical protein
MNTRRARTSPITDATSTAAHDRPRSERLTTAGDGRARARIGLFLTSFALAACGAKTLDFAGVDGGHDDSAAGTSGAGGGPGTGGAGPGGSSGAGGSGGNGGGAFVTTFPEGRATKIDLLFMIDNSSSMADKQVLVAEAVPNLVDRLIDPLCADPITGRTVGSATNGVCALGVRIFDPITDIHIGIVSSSLGAHGASGVCEDAIDISLGRSDPHNNDQGRLVARAVGDAPVATFQNKGFLNYNPSLQGAAKTSQEIAVRFSDMVRGVGQHGCGYEASLEAVYRFLVDPDPYATIRVATSGGGLGTAVLEGTDQQLLQQRADFLRPDSLVAAVIVTDENDCSVIDGSQGFYPLLPPVPGTGRSAIKGGTSACKANPNDVCCANCNASDEFVPPGCPLPSQDPACAGGELLAPNDPTTLRCFDQKRRYGTDFLYPIERYVDAFSGGNVKNRQGMLVANPLFGGQCANGQPCTRSRDRVIVAGVVGVPWQDVAVNRTNLMEGYKTAAQLRAENIWADIVGDPTNPSGPVPPRDLHMIESIAPRAGLAGPDSAFNADAIHGHEWDPSKNNTSPNSDLQYACIFDLAPQKTCTSDEDCDCFGPDLSAVKKPLCQTPQGAYTTTQSRGKAYPGTRILRVLQGLGDQAVTASICPSNVNNKTSDDYGYTPVVRALIERLRDPFKGQCLPVALPIDSATGQTSCSVIEVFDPSVGSCACDQDGRRPAPDSLLTAEMKSRGACRCEIQQLTGAAADRCRNDSVASNAGDGWCYVDPAQGAGACELVSTCTSNDRRRIRFTTPRSELRAGSTAFFRCELQPIAPLPPKCP